MALQSETWDPKHVFLHRPGEKATGLPSDEAEKWRAEKECLGGSGFRV